MSAPKVPVNMLIDNFDYLEYLGTNDWSEPSFAEAVNVSNCRIDRESVYSSSTSGKTLLYNAVIFCYKDLTVNMIEKFKEQSKVIFDGQEHVITKVIPVFEPYENKLFSIEIEVV